MKTHKVLPHTADVRLWVESDTITGLFEAALEGMAGLIKRSGLEKENSQIEEKIKLDAPDQTALLIDFLSTVLTLCHRNNAVFTQVEFINMGTNSLIGTIRGVKTNGFDEDIKAVTYNEAEIKKNISGRFETNIVFDI